MVDYVSWDEMGSAMRKERSRRKMVGYRRKVRVYARKARVFGGKVNSFALKVGSFADKMGYGKKPVKRKVVRGRKRDFGDFGNMFGGI